MVRSRAARLAAWALALTTVAMIADTPAGARTVQTGTSARVSRERSDDNLTMYWAILDDRAGRVRFVALNGRLVGNRRYAVIDSGGALGTADIGKVETDRTCSNFTYEFAWGQLGPSGRRASYPVIAIGPIDGVSSRASVLSEHGPSDVPPPGQEHLTELVDVDGDRDADLARYIYGCNPNAGGRQRLGYGSHTCVEIWSRRNGAWRLVDKGDFPPCY
jgi:hypothetical protein